MGMTIEEAHTILSNGLVNAPSEHEWCIAFKMAIDTLCAYQQLKADYESQLKVDMAVILNKIRDEIESRIHREYIPYTGGCVSETLQADTVLKIIDKLEDILCNNFNTGTDEDKTLKEVVKAIEELKQHPKIGFCRDCQQWKDSDGVFRRGIDAESKCPINRIEVYEGTGYCYMFK